jgi:cyclopropane-fatty-acyl-phospholipid synthase
MTTPTTAPEIERTVHLLAECFPPPALDHLGFRLWDGSRWPGAERRAATIVLKHPDALPEMLAAGTEQGLAEAYLRDDFDIEGDIEAACGLADTLREPGAKNWIAAVLRLFVLRRRIHAAVRDRAWSGHGAPGERRHSRGRDRQAVRFHYDVSNDFYALWLDSKMLYSCAYFENEADDLETAQTAKLRYLCRKLRLQPGGRLLDIGCGWGGLAIHAAQTRGVHVRGITLSERQAELAASRVRQACLPTDVTIALQDYRDLEDGERYDAIVSVGMAEHVGAENLPDYFRKAFGLLRPGGVFLNHAIGDDVRARPPGSSTFIQEYVFPDSDLPTIPCVLAAAESVGFEVRDVENLREHYTLTLRHWVRRLEAAHDAARAFVDEPTFRIWRLYMAGCARGFERGRMAVYQTLLVKPDDEGRAHLPLTRRDWYEDP